MQSHATVAGGRMYNRAPRTENRKATAPRVLAAGCRRCVPPYKCHLTSPTRCTSQTKNPNHFRPCHARPCQVIACRPLSTRCGSPLLVFVSLLFLFPGFVQSAVSIFVLDCLLDWPHYAVLCFQSKIYIHTLGRLFSSLCWSLFFSFSFPLFPPFRSICQILLAAPRVRVFFFFLFQSFADCLLWLVDRDHPVV